MKKKLGIYEINKIWDYKQKGVKEADIAKVFGISREWVRQVLKRFNKDGGYGRSNNKKI